MEAKITLLIIISNVIFSLIGFNNSNFLHKYMFRVQEVLKNKEYIRLLSAGFLHVDFMHLTFNMFTLYFFGSFLETRVNLPIYSYLAIYFICLVGGNLLALLLNKNKGNYAAVGASGAVTGILFATIAYKPDLTLGIFFIIPMPAWLYGIGFILFSIYGIKKQSGNIGHEAHLGGAIMGILSMIAIEPSLFMRNYILILSLLVPAIVFLILSVKYPHLLQFKFKNSFRKTKDIDIQYMDERKMNEEKLNRILEKIHNYGIDSLSKEESDFLRSKR